MRTFRHAIALDERRSKFKANLWNRPNAEEQILSVTDQKIKKKNGGKKRDPQRQPTLRALEKKYGKDRSLPTDIEEVTKFHTSQKSIY